MRCMRCILLHSACTQCVNVLQEVKSRNEKVNHVLDELTHRLVKHFQLTMASDKHVRVLKLVCEYVMDHDEQIWLSQIVNCFVCEHDAEDLKSFPHQPTSFPEQTLTVWPPHWMVKRSRKAPKMAPPPPRHVLRKKNYDERLTERPFEQYRNMKDKGSPLLNKAEQERKHLSYRHAAPCGKHVEFQAKRGLCSRKTFRTNAIAKNFVDPKSGAVHAEPLLRSTQGLQKKADLVQRRHVSCMGAMATKSAAAGSAVVDLSKHDVTARMGGMSLWEPEKAKVRYKYVPRAQEDGPSVDDLLIKEIESIAQVHPRMTHAVFIIVACRSVAFHRSRCS